jgi:hypothetical protein
MQELRIGDRVRLGGGYDMEPKWLNGKEHYTGTVEAFIPGQNDTPAAIVELDEVAVCDDTRGSIVVLELRYVDAMWTSSEAVHVELCDFVPEAKSWNNRKQGKWVESHARYEKI